MPRVSAYAGCFLCAREWEALLRPMLDAARSFVPDSSGMGEPHSAVPEVTLFVLRDGDIVDINRNGLGLLGPTNILSFPSGGEGALLSPDARAACGEGRPHLGELYLSADTLTREAVLYGQDPTDHARRLLAHGMGHLLGYDHGEDMDTVCEALLDFPGHAGPGPAR